MSTKMAKYPSAGKEKSSRSPKFSERSSSLVFPQKLSRKKSPTHIDEPRSPLWSSTDIDNLFGDETQRRKSKRKKPSPRTLKIASGEEHKKNVLFDVFFDLESNENTSFGEVKKARSSGSTKLPPATAPAPRNAVSWPDMPKVQEPENNGGKNNNFGKSGKNNILGGNGSDSVRGNNNNNNNIGGIISQNFSASIGTESFESKKKGTSGGSKSPPHQLNSRNNGSENQEVNNVLFPSEKKKKHSSSSLSRTPPRLSRTPVKHKAKERSSFSPSPSPTSTSDEADPTLSNPSTLAWLELVNPICVETNSNHQKSHSHHHEKKSMTYSRKSTKERHSSSFKSTSTMSGAARGVDQGPQGPSSKSPEPAVVQAPQGVQENHLSEFKDGRSGRVRIKCVWEEDKRFVWVHHKVTVEELLLAIENKYELPVQFGQIKFRDNLDPNDLMTITTQDDLDMLFASDRVEIFVVQPSPSSSPSNSMSTTDGGLHTRNSEDPHVVSMLEDPDTEREQSRSSSPVTRESSPDSIHNNNNKWIIKSKELIIPPDTKPLGCGYFGEVRLGYWRRRRVACKKIFEQNFRSRTDMEIFCREVKILSELRHPNIVLFLGACTDGKDKMIVTEYCQGGDLASFLKHINVLHEHTQLDIAKDVAAGMNHLHLENVLHRDLTSSNILLSASYEAKVSDFGLSRRLFANTSLSCTMGSVAWMAPEVIENAKNFTKKSDVYSYAVILWELLTRQDPCPPNMSPIMLATKVLHEQYRPTITPGQIPEQWSTLIQKCWSQNPDDRPTFDDILEMLENFDLSEIPTINVECPSPTAKKN